jgi:hypothetical protein
MSWVGFKRIFYNPVMWFFTFAYSFWSWSQNANVWFALFLKSVKNSDGTARFSVPQINTIPIGGCKWDPALALPHLKHAESDLAYPPQMFS